MATHFSTLAWKIPWTEEPGGLQSMGSLRVRHDWATSLSLFTFTFHFHALEKEMATHSSVLAWTIPGTGEPGGLPSVGSHRVGHDWSDSAAAADSPLSLAFPFPLAYQHLCLLFLFTSPELSTLLIFVIFHMVFSHCSFICTIFQFGHFLTLGLFLFCSSLL